MSNKILVVGASGNVGSAVVGALVAKGETVRGLAHSEAGAEAGAQGRCRGIPG
jgi:uncharacterized protein YbjT (DUF2867 family)